MDYNKIEDAVFKKTMKFFKDNAVNFFGINAKIIAVAAETVIKNIEIKTNYLDILDAMLFEAHEKGNEIYE